MPYGGTTPEEDAKIERCVAKVMPTLTSKYPNEKKRKSHAIAICKSQILGTKSYYFTDLEMKSEEGELYIEGYASSINKDLGNDVLTEECLHQMAEEINKKNIKIGYDHTEILGGRPTLEAVGKLIEAKVKDGKLWVKGVLDKTFTHFDKIKEKIKKKFLDGLSIEYQVDPAKTIVEWKDGVRHRIIKGLKTLFGVALTPRPMNQDAYFDYYIKHLEIDSKKAFAKAPAGEGSRFEACVAKMKARGAKDPRALCAYIGRRKFGKKKFQKMAAAGKSEDFNEIPDEFYDISDMSDQDIDNTIKEFEVNSMAEQENKKVEDTPNKAQEEPKQEVKQDSQGSKPAAESKPEVETKSEVDFEALGRKVYEEQQREKKIAELKSLAAELIKAELKNVKEPYINPADKFDIGEKSPFDAELKAWREIIKDPKADLELKYEAAAKLHNKLSEYGINERGSLLSQSRKWKKVEVKGQNFEIKNFEYKAQLEHDTNKVSDTDYYQNAAELNDIYDPIIIDHLNNKTTLWGLIKKKNVSNIGSERYGFRVRTGRIAGIGGDTSTYNYDERAALTGYHATKLKCQIPFMQYGVTVQVSGLMQAAARGSIGDAFAKEIKFATADLLKGINVDLYGTADGMTDGGKILGLEVIGDDGGTYANIYGHARATYTTLQGTDDAQTNSPNISKTLLRTAIRTVEKNGANRANLIIVCDQIQRDKILGMLDPAQRFNSTSARAGFEGLPTFDGIPIHADSDCPDGKIWVLPMDSYYAAVLQPPTFEDLAKTDDSKKGFIKTYFAIVCENPNWVYKITGLNTS
jgi:hypothetical protein